MRIKHNMLETGSIWQGILKKGTNLTGKIQEQLKESKPGIVKHHKEPKDVCWGVGGNNIKMTGSQWNDFI